MKKRQEEIKIQEKMKLKKKAKKSKQLRRIINECEKFAKNEELKSQNIEFDLLIDKMLAEKYINLSDTLRDFDEADSESLKQLYDYRRKMDEEERDQQREATIDYYTGMQDPSRQAAKADLDKPAKTAMTLKYSPGKIRPAAK